MIPAAFFDRASILGVSALFCKAQTPKVLQHSQEMTRPTPKVILAENLAGLMKHHGFVKKSGEPNQSELARKLGGRPDQTTIGRILRGEMSPTMDVLHDLSKAFDLHEWQLMVPYLDPSNPPVQVMSQFERDFYARLEDIKRQALDGFKYKVL